MKLIYMVVDQTYQTIKEVLKRNYNMSQRLIYKLKENKKVLLNNQFIYLDKTLTVGDIIEITIDSCEENGNVVPTKMDLDIIYEDEAFLILNKPPKTAIHPSNLHYSTSLSNGVKYYYDLKGIQSKIHLVNRLDKDTSGLVIFAKNEYIQECLIKQMKQKDFHKEYIAVIEGHLENNIGTIDAPIARLDGSIIERCVSENGEKAITHYEVIKYLNNNTTLVKFVLETGRTHQIRVHSKYMGHPIIGDTLYGKESIFIHRQALHSYITSFIHPITKEKVTYMAQIPEDIQTSIDKKQK